MAVRYLKKEKVMKSYIKKLSLFAIFGLMISSYGFAGGRSKLTVKFPDDSFSLYTEDQGCSTCGWYGNRTNVTNKFVSGYPINPSKDDFRFVVSQNETQNEKNNGEDNHKDIAASKKMTAVAFKGFAGWNWTFKKDGSFIREGLDNDLKTVLLQEINGLGNVTYDKRKGNTANYIDVNSWINS